MRPDLPVGPQRSTGLVDLLDRVLDKGLVIAGPAEGYVVSTGGRALGVTSAQPALRLDDLLVALRSLERGNGTIRCSIDPNPANLAKFVSFVAESQEAGQCHNETSYKRNPGAVMRDTGKTIDRRFS